MNCKLLILRSIYNNNNISQRDLSKDFFISLGKVNSTLKELTDENLLKGTNHYIVTNKGEDLLLKYKVDCAVIITDSEGIKLNPNEEKINKSFIKINNEILIEKTINNLKAIGINKIYIVVGFEKEKFDYLIDKYNVILIYNKDYEKYGSLTSLYSIKDYIKNKNSYIINDNLYNENNIFNTYEFEPYFIANYIKEKTHKKQLYTTVQNEILEFVSGGEDSYFLCGITFLTKEFLNKLLYLIERYYEFPQYKKLDYEEIVERNLDILPPIYSYKKENIIEFNNIKDIKNYDESYYGASGFSKEEVTKTLDIKKENIEYKKLYKEDTKNNYFLFNINKKDEIKQYLYIVPNEENEYDFQNKIYEQYYDKLIENNLVDKNTQFVDNKNIKIIEFNEKDEIIDTKDKNNIEYLINIYKNLHKISVKLNSNQSYLLYLIEKYENILKQKNINSKFIDFKMTYEKFNIIKNIVKKRKINEVLTNINLYEDNIIRKEDGKLYFLDFTNVAIGDYLDDITNICSRMCLSVDESIVVLKKYLDVKNVNNENIDDELKNVFVMKIALNSMLFVIYSMIKEKTTMIDMEDFELKQYREFKNMIKYLEDKNFI